MKSGSGLDKKRASRAGDSRTPAITAFRRGLASLNLSDQKAIFDRLPVEIKAALWRDRIREAVNERALSIEQKKVLKRIGERLTPAVYEDRSRARRKQFANFCHRIEPQVRAAFETQPKLFQEISTLLGERNQTARIAQVGGLPTCDCSLAARQTDADDCDEKTNCKRVPCVATKSGCGRWWAQACDGICK